MRKRSKHRFSVGEEVVCYKKEGFTYGKVTTVDGEKVVVAMNTSCYASFEPVTEPHEYTRRMADGLYVHADSASQQIPDQMISTLGDFNYMFRGRSHTSLAVKMKQGRSLLRFFFANLLDQRLDYLDRKYHAQKHKN